MAPRRYRMDARAEAVAETRDSIVSAAKQLHAAQGVQVTSWDEIAALAGVSTSTVYRHFPSLDDLVPACARSVFDIIQPPTVEDARVMFAGKHDPADRLEQLVRDSCACYAKGRGWLRAAHRERDLVPELDTALRVIEDSLVVLVEAAADRRLSSSQHQLLFVLSDFPLWWSLTHRGLGPVEAEDQVVRLVRTEAARIAGSNLENRS